MRLWLDVYDSNGDRIGPSRLGGGRVRRLQHGLEPGRDVAGAGGAGRPGGGLAAGPRRTVLAWMADGDQRWFVGGGVIDQLTVRLGAQGETLLDVSGQDLIEELNRFAVGETVIDNTLPATEEGTSLAQFFLHWLPSTRGGRLTRLSASRNSFT